MVRSQDAPGAVTVTGYRIRESGIRVSGIHHHDHHDRAPAGHSMAFGVPHIRRKRHVRIRLRTQVSGDVRDSLLCPVFPVSCDYSTMSHQISRANRDGYAYRSPGIWPYSGMAKLPSRMGARQSRYADAPRRPCLSLLARILSRRECCWRVHSGRRPLRHRLFLLRPSLQAPPPFMGKPYPCIWPARAEPVPARALTHQFSSGSPQLLESGRRFSPIPSQEKTPKYC